MTSKAVKLDDSTIDHLKVLGEIRQRSPHWLMKEAIRQFLDREEAAEQIRLGGCRTYQPLSLIYCKMTLSSTLSLARFHESFYPI